MLCKFGGETLEFKKGWGIILLWKNDMILLKIYEVNETKNHLIWSTSSFKSTFFRQCIVFPTCIQAISRQNVSPFYLALSHIQTQTYNYRSMCILPGQHRAIFSTISYYVNLKHKIKNQIYGKKREWNGSLFQRWESF